MVYGSNETYFEICSREEYVQILHEEPPTTDRLQDAIGHFAFDGNPDATMDEAREILSFLWTEPTISGSDYVCGLFETGWEVALFVGTYGQPGCYGIRYGLPEPGRPYFGSNDTYSEVCL